MHGRMTARWMAASFSVALAIACIALCAGPSGDRIGTALRATGRWSFMLFWLASSGAATAALFGSRFQFFRQRVRDFGLAFASAHLVHMALVAILYSRAVDPPLSRELLIFFSIAAVWTYLLAISSFDRLSAALRPKTWSLVRRLGIEYINLAFFVDFAKNPLQDGIGHLIAYVPFLILSVAGPVFRLAAAAARRHGQARGVASDF